MRAGIVLFPGTNRERDMALALKRASGAKPVMLWHGEADLPAGVDLVVLPAASVTPAPAGASIRRRRPS